ncbi:hypothetical protein [Paenibacillus sp. sgz302251]|uniref:hypothetical protein n=1 Tax=Paenibacillus sp. sgz302251 TaxID=3414493 RepID=UPI003C7D207A
MPAHNAKQVTEKDIFFDFSNALQVNKGDAVTINGMKFVDFIIELADRFIFLEVKDPDNPRATPEAKLNYLRKMRSREIGWELGQKVKDTLLYEWARDRRLDKPIHYVVLMEASFADSPTLLALIDRTKGYLPLGLTNRPEVKRNCIDHFLILTLQKWNEHYAELPAHRMSNTIAADS